MGEIVAYSYPLTATGDFSISLELQEDFSASSSESQLQKNIEMW